MRPRLSMPKRWPLFCWWYVDPEEFTPRAGHIGHVERVLGGGLDRLAAAIARRDAGRRGRLELHAAERSVAEDAMERLHRLGWRHPAAGRDSLAGIYARCGLPPGPEPFAPDPEHKEHVMDLIRARFFHMAAEGCRGTAHEVITMLYWLGWRPPGADDPGAEFVALSGPELDVLDYLTGNSPPLAGD